jgi:hypothetical protein
MWPLAGLCGPLAADLDPLGDKGLISPSGTAEGGSVPRPGLMQLTLTGAQEDARYLGEQVRPTACDLPQLGDRGLGGRLVGRLQRA